MTSVIIYDVLPYTQSVATASQTVFSTTWTADVADDVVVYQRASGSTPDDTADLLPSSAYTVDFIGGDEIVQVTLVTGATAGDIVTITRVTPVDRENLYTTGNFTSSMLNQDFGLVTLMIQENDASEQIRTPRYPNSAIINTYDTILPILAANQSWRMNSDGDGIEAAELLDVDAVSGVTFIIQQSSPDVPSAQALGDLATGIMKSATTTGVVSVLTGSSGITAVIDDDTMATAAATNLSTSEAIKTYVDAHVGPGAGAGGSNTQIQYNDAGRFGGDSGFTTDGAGNLVVTGSLTIPDAAANDQAASLGQVIALVQNEPIPANYSSAGTDSLSTWTYDNGASGLDATLTAPANGSQDFDGQTPSDGDVIFVIDQSSNLAWQGLYTIVQGTGGTPCVLTRSTDYDEPSEINFGDQVLVALGDTYAGTAWLMNQTAAITIGTTDITFVELGNSGALLKANNLSDLTSASTARTNLGLGTMAVQNATAVAITGGTINGATIGATTPAAGTFTTAQGGNILLTTDYIEHVGDTDNYIGFGTDTQDFQTGGSSRMDISNSGVRFGGANSRIMTILDEDDMSSDSATALATQQSIKAYVDAQVVASGTDFSVYGRLTLTSGTPVTTSNVTAATTWYFTPYKGNTIPLYNGSSWDVITFSEISIAVPATTSQMYDIFCYNNAGTATLELVAWTNDTTRATALTTQDGVYVKSGDATRLYLGSGRTTTSSGQTEDSLAKRYLWNYYNRVHRPMKVIESTASWTYSTSAYRQANANTANQLDCVIGVAEDEINIRVLSAVNNSTSTGRQAITGIGINSTTVNSAIIFDGAYVTGAVPGFNKAYYIGIPAVGRSYYPWLEWGGGSDTQTWSGTTLQGHANTLQTGIIGYILG